MFKRIPGTHDILPHEMSLWHALEHAARRIFTLYNYTEIRPPIIEEASLFDRSLGEFAEIVQKQMFVIKHGEDTYALRPEGTASIVRAYIENNLDKTTGFLKAYYMGPMFRLERPQKGRQRQFHHIGCEAIGSAAPGIDVEVIALADTLLKEMHISGYRIVLNSLGCLEDKISLTELLKKDLAGKRQDLCQECQTRFDKNILRILDCKHDVCKEIVKGINIGERYLCAECLAHFSSVKEGLDALGIAYTVSPHLVRGLDYYTRTVFEIKHDSLGAQDAIGAGGRYDNLVEELGGAKTASVGFAFGVERLLLAADHLPVVPPEKLVYVVSMGDAARRFTMTLAHMLRGNGFRVDMDYEGKSLKGAMRKANDQSAAVVLIVGDNELAKQSVMVKDMRVSQQREVPVAGLVEELTRILQMHNQPEGTIS